MSESDVRSLIALIERTIGRSWLDFSEWLRSQNRLDDIDRMLRTGDFAGITRSVQEAAQKFAADEAAAFATAGTRVAEALAGDATGLMHFDAINAGAVRWAQQNQLELVQGLADEARQTIRQVLIEGARSSANPIELARDIRDSLGLTPDQQRWLDNYRTALESRDYTNALDRELSHGYSDRAILAAQRRDVDMSPEAIDTAVDRYRANIIAYRAENVARTEGLKVAHQAQDEAMRQAVQRGNLNVSELQGVWNAGPATKNAREMHQEVDGTKQPYGTPWIMADGVRMKHPGDPAGGAKHCCSCRCAMAIVVRRAA